MHPKAEIEAVAQIVYREVAASDPYHMENARDVAIEILDALARIRAASS
jgi:hypothetical protein